MSDHTDMRRFVRSSVMPHAGTWDREQRLPAEVISELAGMGGLASTLPREAGGAGSDLHAYGLLHEEIGRGCSSLRSLVTVHDMVATAVHRWAEDGVREHVLPGMISGEILGAFALTEPSVGSDAAAVEATAARTGDGWALDGTKLWVTGGTIASQFLVFARVEDRATAFLVDRESPGLTIAAMPDMLGLRAAMPAKLVLADCRVPADRLIGQIGFGVSLVASEALLLGRFGVACGCVGLAQAGLDAAVAHANEREQFGKRLREHGLVQGLVADMLVGVEAARRLCRHAGRRLDARESDAPSAVLVAKAFAAPAAVRVARDAVQILGARGCSAESVVSRLYRDAKIMEIIEGSTQVLQTLLAGHAFRTGRRRRP